MNKKIEQTVEENLPKKRECHHYWIIESPRGPISRGVCKHCGEEREFNNIFTATWYDDEDDMPAFMRTDFSFSVEDDNPDKP